LSAARLCESPDVGGGALDWGGRLGDADHDRPEASTPIREEEHLAVALIALAAFHFGLGLLSTIRCQRLPHVAGFFEPAFDTASDEPFVRAGVDQLALGGSSCPPIFSLSPSSLPLESSRCSLCNTGTCACDQPGVLIWDGPIDRIAGSNASATFLRGSAVLTLSSARVFSR
jgi:hypothetical protein